MNYWWNLVTRSLLIVTCFSGCRHWGGTRSQVRIGEAQYPLATVQSYPGEVAFVQQVEGTLGEKSFQYNLQGEIVSGEWALVGLTPTGFRLFLLTMRDREIDYDPRWGFHLELPPNLLLAAWQLAYWPEMTALPPQVPGAVEIEMEGTSAWKGPVQVRIPDRELSLTFRTLMVESF